jgi:type I restriction enzyme S subunit
MRWELSELPENWVQVSLGDIATVTSGIGFPLQHQGLKSGELPFFKVGDVSRAFLNNRGNLTVAQHYVSSEMAKKLHGKPIQPGSTVFAKIGEALKLNRRAYVHSPCLIDNNVMAVKALDSRLDRYVYFFLMASDLTEFSRATTVPSLRKGDIESLKFPLPPLDEQKRIAEKLDTLLARVDSCQSHLERVPQILKRFRQSVLAAATSGRLTEDWREERAVNGEWEESTFGETGSVSGGLTKNQKRNLIEWRKPYLRVANVYANKLELDDVSEIGLTQTEFEKTRLLKDDLLIVEGNGSLEQIGRAAIWNNEIVDCVHQNHIIRWRTNGNVIPKFALFWLLSPEGRSFMVGIASSTTGLHTLSISKVSSIPIRVPSPEEQAEIVRRVKKLFAYAERLEARYTSASEHVERLTPSLLAKAFRGELVEQVEGDEVLKVYKIK